MSNVRTLLFSDNLPQLFTGVCCLQAFVVYSRLLFTGVCCLHAFVVYRRLLFTCVCCLQAFIIQVLLPSFMMCMSACVRRSVA